MKATVSFTVLVAIMLAGCVSEQLIKQREASQELMAFASGAEEVYLVRLDPDASRSFPGEKPDVRPRLGRWPISGRVEISSDRAGGLCAALADDVVQARAEMQLLCFWPEQGIAVRRGTQVDFILICRKCSQLEIVRAGRILSVNLRGTSAFMFREVFEEMF